MVHRWGAAVFPALLLAGCASFDEGCAPRSAYWQDEGFANSIVGDPAAFGFRYVPPYGPGVPFNGTVPGVSDSFVLREVQFGYFQGGLTLDSTGSATFIDSFKEVPASDVERMAWAFVANVSTLRPEEQGAWVAGFLANRTIATNPGVSAGEPRMFTSTRHSADLPRSLRLEELYEEVLAAGETHASPGSTVVRGANWTFSFSAAAWAMQLGWEEGVALDRVGHVEYSSEAGPEEAPWFGSEGRLRRHIQTRFHEEGLPPPSFQDFDASPVFCSKELRFEE